MHPLQAFRLAHHLSRRRLADEIGISEVHVWRLERGISFPSYTLANRLVEFSRGELTHSDFAQKQPNPRGRAGVTPGAARGGLCQLSPAARQTAQCRRLQRPGKRGRGAPFRETTPRPPLHQEEE